MKKTVRVNVPKSLFENMKASKEKVLLDCLLECPYNEWPVLETVETKLGTAYVLGTGVDGCSLQVLAKYCERVF